MMMVKRMKSEEIIEELEKSKVSWGKVFLITLQPAKLWRFLH